MAWVLPITFLTAEYAKAIREAITKNFRRSIAITVAERLFVSEGTEETTVILIAEDYKPSSFSAEMEVTCIDRADDLTGLLANWAKEPEPIAGGSSLGSGLIPPNVVDQLAEIAKSPNFQRLGNVARVQIGLVAGDTSFFIKSKEDWLTHRIPDSYLRYIAPPSKGVRGISLDTNDVQLHDASNARCWALYCPSSPRSKFVKAYLETYDDTRLKTNATFKKRATWHYFFDENEPDAFLVFLTNLGPRIVLNCVKANCTNSMYRVYFKKPCSTHFQKLVAVSIHSTVSQLSAELVGHGRGSGALKLEPSNALSMLLYLPDNKTPKEITDAFSIIDNALRRGDTEEATRSADDFLFRNVPQVQAALPILRQGLALGRTRRMRNG